MDLTITRRAEELRTALLNFMQEHVYPSEAVYAQQVRASGDPYHAPPIMEELKAEAQRRGLWNLFLPDADWGPGLTNLEYAPLAEVMGRSSIAPEACNCSAPDTGNMEILAQFGTAEVKERFLRPLLEGRARSGFSMTEPAVASSDATNLQTRIAPDDDGYVVNGRKWWTTGAMDARTAFLIVLGVSDPDAAPHRRQSMVVVPIDTPGVVVERGLSVFGYDMGRDGEIHYDSVRVPRAHLLGEEGGGFDIGQARLGPGRIHHAMRSIGMAERAFDLMCERAHERRPFGKTLAEQGVVQEWIAEARVMIEQARLLVLKTAWMVDNVGAKAARTEIGAIKLVATRTASWVVDRAIQTFGGAGVSQDTPLAEMAAMARVLHIADGPDEVHRMAIARRELRRYEVGG